jgi:MATE family multidrug resistance protein
MGMVYTGTFALLYVAVPDAFFIGHKNGVSADEFAAIRDTTVILLRFVACYCIFDAFNVIFASAIKGAGDVRFIVLVNLVASPVAILLTLFGIDYFVSVGRPHAGLMYCWWVLTAWVTSLGLAYFARFVQGKWKSMRVIEAVEPALPLTAIAPNEAEVIPAMAPDG